MLDNSASPISRTPEGPSERRSSSRVHAAALTGSTSNVSWFASSLSAVSCPRMSLLRLPRSPGTWPRMGPNGSNAVTRIAGPLAMTLGRDRESARRPCQGAVTFEVIDRRPSRIDDHAREANQMPTMEEYAGQPREQRMQRLTRTADELAAAIKGRSEHVLSRRPDAKNWAAKEIVCNQRDTEEVFAARVEQVRVMDVDPRWGDSNADRMAEERQYLRNDAADALAAVRRRRAETLEIFGNLTPAQWEKGGIHAVRGRFMIDKIASIVNRPRTGWTRSCRSWPGTTTT